MSSPSSASQFPTGTPAPSPPSSAPTSSSTPQGTSDPTANATLYLYTFLATLVLLLAVSSAIVIRSLILRRRHQRLVEEAIRTGTWLPHHFNSTTNRRRRDIGQKPRLWEAWLNPEYDEGEGEDEGEENEKRNWRDIMPVHAAYVNPPAPIPQGPTGSSTEHPAEPLSRPVRFIRPFIRRRSPPLPPPHTVLPIAGQDPPLPSSSPIATPTPTVRVAVLVAMPNPSQKHHDDENGPPVIEIGVVEVNMKDDEVETPSRSY